jgi:4-hydroxy-tetrahydrodipicolinate reductase
MSIINIGLHGASGRMGAAVTEAIARQSDKFDLVTKFSKHRNNYTLLDFCLASDIIIDFSSADALENLLKVSTETDKKLVIGTTGLSSTHIKEIEKASKSIERF